MGEAERRKYQHAMSEYAYRETTLAEKEAWALSQLDKQTPIRQHRSDIEREKEEEFFRGGKAVVVTCSRANIE